MMTKRRSVLWGQDVFRSPATVGREHLRPTTFTGIIGAAKKIHTVLQLRYIVPPLEI
jgi:hypothetical protein